MISIKESEFKQLIDYIKLNYGINLTNKKALIEGRLNNMLVEKGYNNFSEYLSHVFSDSTNEEITKLINKVTTNHTFFMRESEHFEYFAHKVLPMLKSKLRQKDIRIWSAGCSSGQEPYTLAMLIDEYFKEEKALWDTKILATDISDRVLETAQKGIYESESIENIPKMWKYNYFDKIDEENYQIKDKIRKEIIYRKFNLMEPTFPFKNKFHVIFCRNVMIYFDYQTKMQLIEKFYQMTEPGGYLFIGHSESINRNETQYKQIIPAVYQKG